MSKTPKAPKAAPTPADLTLLTPEESALVDTWLTASRAEKAAQRIKKHFGSAMLALIQKQKMITVPAAVIHLGESVSYDYPAEIAALDELSKALKAAAKKDGTAAMVTEPTVTVDDFQQFVDPPAVAEPAVLHGIKSWLVRWFKTENSES